MKSRKKNGTLRQHMAVLLILLLIAGLISPHQIAYAATKDTSIEPDDVSASITWSEPILEAINGTDSLPIKNGIDDFEFTAYYDYFFTIKWAADASVSLKAENYFTFKVPDIFADQTIDMLAPDGTKWGIIMIKESDGSGSVTGTATFNSNVEEKVNVSGTFTLFASGQSLEEEDPVKWVFTFNKKTYTYEGEVTEGLDYNPGEYLPDYSYKWGQYDPVGDDGGNVWVITLNMKQENITGSVTVIDTFGGDYKITPVRYFEHDEYDDECEDDCIENKVKCAYLLWDQGFITADGYDHAYFEVWEIDWNKIRTDYNNDASAEDKVPDGMVNLAMDNMVWDLNVPDDYDSGYKYIQTFDKSKILSAKITEDGIEIVFKEGAVSGKSIQISYWYELSSIKPMTSIQNSAVVLVDKVAGTEEHSNIASIRIGSRATVAGTNGSIVLFKQNRNGTKDFAGVTFTLQKQGSSYERTTSTDESGQLIFELEKNGESYAGIYTLTEASITTPKGYACGDVITFEVNASGAIISINDTSLNSSSSLGTTVDDICWVSKDGLLMIVYNNVITPETEVTLVGTKNFSDNKLLEDDMFRFDVKDKNDKIITTGTNAADGTISFDKIRFTATGTYTYEVSEINDNVSGITYDNTVHEITIKVTENDGALTANVIYPADGIIFNNTYTASSISVTLYGTKLLNGKTLEDGMFDFVVNDVNNEPVSTGTNASDGTITFGEILFTAEGTYRYKVLEIDDNVSEITYDNTVYEIMVEVTENDGALTADVIYPTDGITFSNTYTASSISVTLNGSKSLDGKTLEDGMFDFVVNDVNNESVSTGTNAADGTITFGEILFTAEGTYRYNVSEIVGNESEITYDNTVYEITVEVTENNGTLTADVNYPTGGIAFSNTYQTPTPELTPVPSPEPSLELTPELTPEPTPELTPEPTPELTPEPTPELTPEPTPELTPEPSPVLTPEPTAVPTDDPMLVPIPEPMSVSTDEPTAVPTSEPTSGSGNTPYLSPFINPRINPYVEPSVNIALAGRKNLNGKELTDSMFSFKVEDESGNTVSTGTNSINGTITFGEIHYTSVGTYAYKVSEIKGNANGITYDSMVYTVSVSVTNGNNGDLVATVNYPSGGIVFNNTYTEPSINLTLTGQKNLKGKTLTDNMFSFTVRDADGNAVSTGTNAYDGTITFGNIHYTAAGIYTYNISEVKGNANGVTYDSTVYTVTVRVTDNNGTLTATVNYPAGGIIFNNIYTNTLKDTSTSTSGNTPADSSVDTSIDTPIYTSTEPITNIMFVGKKNLISKVLTDNMFSFKVKDEDGNTVSTGTNSSDGTIIFGEIHYTTAGIYNYTVFEVNNNAYQMSYDSTIYNVTVEVTENNGTLTGKVNYPAGGIVFNNVYTEPYINVSLTGKKNLNGKELTDNMFSFIVKDENDITVSTGTNNTDGTILFGDIHYTEEGTYSYKVSEANGNANGMTYDASVYDITITVIKDETGALTAQVDYPSKGIVFDNMYKSTSITLTGIKDMIGLDLKNDMFEFTITDENGNIISAGTNDSDGFITFSQIIYNKAGKYIYTITADDIDGIYDETEYTVIVTVEDSDTGLIASISEIYLKGDTELKDSIVFTNEQTTVKDEPVSNIPKTGINDMLYLWIIGFCVSICLTGTLLFENHRKRQR